MDKKNNICSAITNLNKMYGIELKAKMQVKTNENLSYWYR